MTSLIIGPKITTFGQSTVGVGVSKDLDKTIVIQKVGNFVFGVPNSSPAGSVYIPPVDPPVDDVGAFDFSSEANSGLIVVLFYKEL